MLAKSTKSSNSPIPLSLSSTPLHLSTSSSLQPNSDAKLSNRNFLDSIVFVAQNVSNFFHSWPIFFSRKFLKNGSSSFVPSSDSTEKFRLLLFFGRSVKPGPGPELTPSRWITSPQDKAGQCFYSIRSSWSFIFGSDRTRHLCPRRRWNKIDICDREGTCHGDDDDDDDDEVAPAQVDVDVDVDD